LSGTKSSHFSLRDREFWLDRKDAIRLAATSVADVLVAERGETGEGHSESRQALAPAASERLIGITGGDPLLTCAAAAAAVGLVLRRFGAAHQVAFLVPAAAGWVPVMLEPQPDMTFRSWLVSVRATIIEARAHARVGEQIIRECVGGDAALLIGPTAPDMAATALMVDDDQATIISSSQVLTPDVLGRLTAAVAAALHEGLIRPDRALADIGVVDAPLKQRLLHEFNGGRDLDATMPYRDLLFAQAALRPDAVAIHDEKDSVTYRELCVYSLVIARRLRAAGLGRESLIALAAPRNAWFLVTAVAILFAGAAYVPLDLAMPVSRRDRLLRHVDAMITTLESDSPAPPGVTTLRLTELRREAEASDDNATSAMAQEILGPPAGPADLAYVIFTSGSTGTPKGACVEHHSFLNLLATRVSDHGLRPRMEIPQTAPLSMDLSIWQMFAGLTAGSTICIVPDEVVRDPATLTAMIVEHRFECMAIVPTLIAVLLDHLQADPAAHAVGSTLRQLISTGELLGPDLARRWHTIMPTVTLLNAYGPAEVADDSTGGPVSAQEGAYTTIGRILPNVRLYVLDSDVQLVPPGVIGEVYIGGESVGRGYLAEPVLTAAAFLPDPFVAAPGSRMYRTGDLGRWRPDGNVELLGRADYQVKIRGRRVELGEIEHILEARDDVAKAVVDFITQDGPDRLIAFVVPAQGAVVDCDALRAHAAEELPPYMVPREIVILAELPRSRNGKISRSQLRALALTHTVTDQDVLLPRNPVESALHEIWCHQLNTSSVSVRGDFFELGGDSIVAIRVVQEAREKGILLRPRDVLEHGTIEALAAIVQHNEAEGEEALAGDAERARRSADLTTLGDDLTAPLTPPQLAFLGQDLPRPGYWNQSVRYELTGFLTLAVLEQALSQLAGRHAMLRARFAVTGGEPVQLVDSVHQGVFPATEFDLRDVPVAKAMGRVPDLADRLHRSLDLQKGPTCRAGLFRMPPGVHDQLLVVIHHAAVDLYSWNVITEDLAELLNPDRDQVAWPTDLSYLRWAQRITEYINRSPRSLDLTYWAGRDWEDCVPLIPEEHRGIERNAREIERKFRSEWTRSRLIAVGQGRRTTVYERLVAALGQALQHWLNVSGGTVEVQLGGHGREDIFDDLDITRTVGYFSSGYPFALPLPARQDYPEYTQSVARHLHEIPHNGLDFGLGAYLHPDEGTRQRLLQIPVPHVLFNFRSAPGFLSGGSGGEVGLLGDPHTDGIGADRDPDAPRQFPLEVYAGIVGGALSVRWLYSPEALADTHVSELADSFFRALRAGHEAERFL
jgi:amino acid adenylation domain-containing protein/non-ribosomal peptide synthase protein (TIGR01720 family)